MRWTFNIHALSPRPRTSEAVAYGSHHVGIAVVLSEEIVLAAADDGDVDRRPPVTAGRLGIFSLDPHSAGILPQGSLESDTSVGVNRVACAAEKRAGKTAIGSKRKRRAPSRHHFPRITADQAQLARLPLELHDVEHDIVEGRAGRLKKRAPPFQREPRQRPRRSGTRHS